MTDRRREGTDPRVTVESVDALASADTAAALSRGLDSQVQSASALASANTMASASERVIPAQPDVLPMVGTGAYLQLDEFARGGLGRIVRAKDTRTGRIVAIKEMLVSSADAAARFVREALVTANLQHPAIVPVYEVGRWPSGQPFYAMKLVRGRPLDQVIADCKDMDARLGLLQHVVTVADALAYAHGERVIHRDLKPQNVLCGAHGETVVIDWGLARRLDEQDAAQSMPRISSAPPGATYVGAVMGTPAYMPPEQARGERVDEHADVYAIGALLYHTLAGRPPYQGKTLQELIETVKAKPPAVLREVEPRVPPDLAAIVERAMARDPAQRYPSAIELVKDLRRFTDGQLVLAHHYTRGQRLRRFIGRHRGVIAIATVGLVALGVVGGFAVARVMAAKRDAETQRERADHERDEARNRLVKAYVDRARSELGRGQPSRSLAFALASAEAAEGDASAIDTELRFLVGRSLDALPAVRRYHDPKLTSAWFVPGSDDLVIASGDGVTRWSPDADTRRWSSPGGTGDVIALDTKIVAAGRLHGIDLLDAETGKVVETLRPRADRKTIGMIGSDHDRRWLATPTGDTVELFDVARREHVASVAIAKVDRAPLVAADAGKLLVAMPGKVAFTTRLSLVDRSGTQQELCANCYVNAWAGEREVAIAAIPEFGRPARVAFYDWNGKVRLELAPNTNASVIHIDVSPELGRFAIALQDGVVEVRDLATGRLAWSSQLRDRAYQATFDTRGRLWVLGSYTGVRLYDAISGVELGRWSDGGIWLAISGDRDRLAVLEPKGGLTTWPIGDPVARSLAPSTSRVWRLRFLEDGNIVTGSEDGTVAVFDAKGHREIGKHGARVNELLVLADGNVLSSSRDGTTVVRKRDGTVVSRIADGPRAAVTRDGWIATGNPTSTVTLWGLDGKQRRVLGKVGSKSLMAVRWSPDGQRVAGIDEDGEVKVWSRDGTLVRAIPKSKSGIDVVFSPDGRWLVRCSQIRQQTLFSLAGGEDRELAGSREVTQQSFTAAFSRDGKRVLIAGSGFATVWNGSTGEIETSIGSGTDLIAAGFLADDQLIVAGGVDRKVHVWHAKSNAEVTTLAAPEDVYGLVIDGAEARIGVLTLGAAMVWRLGWFTGDLEALKTLAKCRTQTEVEDGVPRHRTIDLTACNKLHAAQKP